METVRKILKQEDFESLSQYANTRYGQMRATPSNMKSERSGGTELMGVSRRSAGQQSASLNSASMQQTFLSSNMARTPDANVFNTPSANDKFGMGPTNMSG